MARSRKRPRKPKHDASYKWLYRPRAHGGRPPSRLRSRGCPPPRLPDGAYPPILPVVVHNSERPWNAATDIVELFGDMPEELLGYLPRHRYLLLDLRAIDPSLLPAENVVSLIAMLQQARSQRQLERLGASLADWL